MKKLGILFAGISEKGVKILILLILAVLTVWVGQDTYLYPEDYSNEILIWREDNLFRQLAWAAAAMLLTGVLSALLFRGKEERWKEKFVKRFAVFEIILIGVLLVTWVAATRFSQSRDAQQVYYILRKFRAGDYSDMNSCYLQGFQQQLGLMFLEDLLLSLWPDIRIFQYLNVLFILGIIFFLYRISDLLFHNQTINLYCLAACAAFLPMHFYVNLAYGDICSISLSLMAVWALMRWSETRLKRYAAAAAAGMCISMLARKNTLIILIAMIICLVIHAWKEWDWRPCVLALLIAALSLGSPVLAALYYQARSGVELGDSMPAVLWIAMGIHGEPGAYGVYNGYHESVFWGTGGNAQEASAIARTHIRERLEEFAANPPLAYDFYKNKILQQWGENTYGSMILTLDRQRCEGELVQNVYFGSVRNFLLAYMNHYTFLLYFGTLLFAAQSLSRKDGIWCCLMPVIITGGFLFSMLWENKSRYVLPYVIAMIPYMCCGIWILQEKMVKILKILSPEHKRH